MRIGVYGSSFNPVTNAHLWLANMLAHTEGLDKVLFLPASSSRQDKTIEKDLARVEMLELAIKDNKLFELELCEIQAVEGEQYSYYTMQTLRQGYPQDELFFLMGADLLEQLSGWRCCEPFLRDTKFIVIERQNIPMAEVLEIDPLLKKYKQNFKLVYKKLLNEISSSYIRQEFRNGGDPRYLMPEAVYAYIRQNKLYLFD